jgi:integrase
MAAYFQYEVTTMKSSRKVQRRDLATFLNFMVQEAGDDKLMNWTPRLSQAFKTWLQKEMNGDDARRWNDRSVNRILAHLKTFARWVHKYRPFPLGNPMDKIKSISTASLLAIDRAITSAERRWILDAADLLVETGGRSRDRHRYRDTAKRPTRKDYRPYRNRAVVYTLIETGMRRSAIVAINFEDVDFDQRAIRTEEKGGVEHVYQISLEGLQSIKDYFDQPPYFCRLLVS